MKTKLSLVSLLFAVGSLLGPARAETVPAKTIAAAAERAIENAYLRADAAALADAVKPLDAAIARAPNDPALLYTRAFAHYASSVLHRKPTDRAALQQCFETSVSLLERVKGAPWEAEADALRASILGQLIGLKGGMSGMTLGPQSDRLLQRAEKAAPGNPRVLMFRGISLLNTPAIFGGDTAAGTKLLQQAVDRFAAGGSPTNGPQWGQADALTWLGIGKQKTGDNAGARAAWQQALALEPNYAWVKFALLPSLDQKQNRK